MSTFTVTFTGRLGADPELRASAAGKPWASLRVAHTGRAKDSNGGWVDSPTMWLSVAVFGALAEYLAEHARKGDLLLITGRATPRAWVRDGVETTVLDVIADEVGIVRTAARGIGEQPPPAAPARGGWDAPAAPPPW